MSILKFNFFNFIFYTIELSFILCYILLRKAVLL
nr:MAG TPA: hypothetical protein [Bacteriophage sp.]